MGFILYNTHRFHFDVFDFLGLLREQLFGDCGINKNHPHLYTAYSSLFAYDYLNSMVSH